MLIHVYYIVIIMTQHKMHIIVRVGFIGLCNITSL